MKPKRCSCMWETAPKAQSCFRLLEPRCEDIEILVFRIIYSAHLSLYTERNTKIHKTNQNRKYMI
jgi:hypothetical protein